MNTNTGKINILIGGNAENFYKAIGGVQKTLNGLTKNLDQIAKNISTNVSLPLTILGGIATNTAATFSDSMLKVQALTSATDTEFQTLTDTAKQLGINTKFSASQVGDAMTYMGLAGWNTTQILNGVGGVLDLAAASGEDLAKVSDILTDGLSAFGKEAGYASRMADILAKTSAKSNTTVGLLGEGFKYVAPLAGALKFSVEDVGLALGIMANAGIKGSQAGTALRATLSRLVKPTKESEEALKALNFSAINSDGSIKPLTQIIEELRGKFKTLSPAQQASNAAMLAGQEAMSGFLALINASDKDFNNLKKNIIDSDGAAVEMAEKMESGLGGVLRIIRSSIEGIGITIGEKLTPYIMSASKVINTLSNSFNNLSPTILSVITGLGVALAVIPPLIVGIGQLIKIVSSSINAFKVLVPILSGISLPVLAIAAAIGVAVGLIIYYWDDIKAYFTTGDGVIFMESLKQLWDSVLSSIGSEISNLVNTTKEIWSRYGKDVIDIFSSLFSVVKGQLQSIVEIVSLAIRGLATIITVFAKIIRGDFKGAFEAIRNFAVDAFKTITNVILNSFKSVMGVASTIAEKLGFDSIADSIEEATKKLDEFQNKFTKVSQINQSSTDSIIGDSTVLPPIPLDGNIDTNSGGNGSGGTGGIRKTIEALQFVKQEFDITTSFAGKKINELGKKAMDAGIKMYEVAKNITFSFQEYMTYFHQFQNGTYVALEGLMIVGDGIQDMFINLFETGKISFQGLIKQVTAFIGKMIGAIAAAAILSTLVGAIFGGGSAIGTAMSFGNLATQFSGGLLNFGGGRANGGQVDMGTAYMVGERGRELFVPNSSGTIISNDKLNMSGNSNINISGTLTASGPDLKLVLDKENKRRSKV